MALLGIAQKTILVKYPANIRDQKRTEVLKLNIKTVGDWIKVKRIEKNLMLGQYLNLGVSDATIEKWVINI